MERAYSKEKNASAIFMDLLNSITLRGWYQASPGTNENGILYVSYHIHPDDSDRIFGLISEVISTYKGKVDWILKRNNHNRFFMCPKAIDDRAKQLGSFDKAYDEFLGEDCEIGVLAAESLKELSDLIYKRFQDRGEEKFIAKD